MTQRLPLTGAALDAVSNADHPNHAIACAAAVINPATGHAVTYAATGHAGTLAATFEAWLDAVDRHLVSQVGLPHQCLTDMTWRDWYDADLSPDEAAGLAIDTERAELSGLVAAFGE